MRLHKLTALAGGLVLTASLAACGGSSDGSDDAASGGYGRCDVAPQDDSLTFEPAVDGQLTVAVPLPSPNGYQGDTPESIDGGYMYCMAADIASRAGLEKVVVKNTSFESIVTGRGGDFDIAIWNVIRTDERAEAVDFSEPYMLIPSAVAVKEGEELDEGDLADAQIGVLIGSFQETLAKEKIQPRQPVRQFQSNEDMFTALRAGQVDVVLQDLTTLMPAAKASGGGFEVIAKFEEGGEPGVVLPKDSPNTATVDSIVADWLDSGDLDAIFEEWLNPILGGDPNDVPVWTA